MHQVNSLTDECFHLRHDAIDGTHLQTLVAFYTKTSTQYKIEQCIALSFEMRMFFEALKRKKGYRRVEVLAWS